MPKPSLPQGTRDFAADTVRKRNYIFNTIRAVFELYGFEPLETPAMENLDTLMGKYGDEGDKLIFKILNNGLDRVEKHDKGRTDFELVLQGKNVPGITERALRYDLTIPFARFVAMNHGKLTFPFKRYQMQPVWRADRPQKGRYREFYQCDADMVGSTSLYNELDLVHIYAQAFTNLNVPVEIRVNSRLILLALAEQCGLTETLTDITTAIDKLDKIGMEKVKEELNLKGVPETAISIIENYLTISGTPEQMLNTLGELLSGNQNARKGINDLAFLLKNFKPTSENVSLVPDFTLARGLNYYTGAIFEVKAIGVQMGSIGGGGRYDDLTGLFDVPNIPGVGISFGVDRIYDVMEELKLFPDTVQTGTKALFFNLGQNESLKAFELMQALRGRHISCELYHEHAKFDKQFKYAEKKGIRFAIIIGAQELQDEVCSVKKLATGEQTKVEWKDLERFDFG